MTTLNVLFGPLDGRRPRRFFGRTIAFRTHLTDRWHIGTVGRFGIVTDSGADVAFDQVTRFVPLDTDA